MHQVISSEVLIYKISQQDTTANIYGEAIDRRYLPGVRVFASVEPEDTTSQTDSDHLDFNKSMLFSFIKSDLKNQNIFLEEGDIIWYDDGYFEVDTVNDEKYWMNKNPNTNIGVNQNNWRLDGYDYTIICQTHLTKKNLLNIENDLRTGDNSEDYVTPNIPKYL